MNIAVIAALVACLAFVAAGPHLARVLPPPATVRLLVPAALLAAGGGVFTLGTVAFTWLAQATEVARFVTWSPQRLHALNPIPPAVGIAAAALLLAAAAWTLRSLGRTIRALWVAHRTGRHLDDHRGSPVVVVDSPDLQAFTLPGISGRIVVTTGMLAALDPDGRRVLLAHEQSHRTHRHTWWTLAADLAAAVTTADRRRVAATIAQVALLRTHPPASATAAAATGGQVPQRVQALLRPPPRIQARHVGVLAALVLAVLLGAFAVQRTGETLFEHAKQPAATWNVASAPTR